MEINKKLLLLLFVYAVISSCSRIDRLSPEGIALNANFELPPYELVDSWHDSINEQSGGHYMAYTLRLNTPEKERVIDQLMKLTEVDETWWESDGRLFEYCNDTAEVIITKPITYIFVNTYSGNLTVSYTWPKEKDEAAGSKVQVTQNQKE